KIIEVIDSDLSQKQQVRFVGPSDLGSFLLKNIVLDAASLPITYCPRARVMTRRGHVMRIKSASIYAVNFLRNGLSASVVTITALVAFPVSAQQTSIPLSTITVEGTQETGTGPVRGYNAAQSATGLKTDTPISQTPQSISVVTADTIKDQGVTTVQEIVRY